MNHPTERRPPLLFGLALLAATTAVACSPSPPTLSLVLMPDPDTPPLTDLTRLRLIVRTCDTNQLALARDIPLNGTPPEKLEAPVLPGTTFYAWLQGWEECNPPCIPEESADEDDCTCVNAEPPSQIFNYEGCTDWIEAENNTLRAIPFAPKSADRLCPPDPLPREDCATPGS